MTGVERARRIRDPNYLRSQVRDLGPVCVQLKLILVDRNREMVEAVTGLATGVGRMAYSTCAAQMFRAYREIVLDGYEYPTSWMEAYSRHAEMADLDEG